MDNKEQVEEIRWKPFIWEGQYTGYSVSEYCNVRNDKTGHILTPSKLQESGRERVHIHINDKPMDFKIYKMGWIAFNGPIPEGMTIDHIDENIYNNHISNLRLLTASENIKSFLRNHPDHGFQKKYPDETIIKYFEMLKRGTYYRDAAKSVGISVDYASGLLHGRRRRDLWELYKPFPESCHKKMKINDSDMQAMKALIISGHTTNEILSALEIEQTDYAVNMVYRVRKSLGIKDPKYFEEGFLQDVDRLITEGKSNQEIYDILEIEFNDRISWMMARRRKLLGISNNNFRVGNAEEKKIIVDMIKDGKKNAEILEAVGKERNKYYIDLLGKTRQKLKKSDQPSETIESIPLEKA